MNTRRVLYILLAATFVARHTLYPNNLLLDIAAVAIAAVLVGMALERRRHHPLGHTSTEHVVVCMRCTRFIDRCDCPLTKAQWIEAEIEVTPVAHRKPEQ